GGINDCGRSPGSIRHSPSSSRQRARCASATNAALMHASTITILVVDDGIAVSIQSPSAMSPKEMTALRLDPDVLRALREYKHREGVPVTVQIEKAVTEWLSKRGVVVKAASRRARTRRKA